MTRKYVKRNNAEAMLFCISSYRKVQSFRLKPTFATGKEFDTRFIVTISLRIQRNNLIKEL